MQEVYGQQRWWRRRQQRPRICSQARAGGAQRPAVRGGRAQLQQCRQLVALWVLPASKSRLGACKPLKGGNYYGLKSFIVPQHY